MPKKLTPLLALLLIPLLLTLPAAASTSAAAAALLLADSGLPLYLQNADTPLPMASTTKIMTALVAIEQGDLEQEIEISAAAAAAEGSSLYTREGERYTLEQLLYGLLLRSGNDCAVAIAEGVAGDVATFVDRMNERAASLGLTATHFENPSGLDAEGHRTTARELALITAEAMKNETFAAIFATKHHQIPATATHDARYLENKHRLLRLDATGELIGGKTGYTRASGRSLVTVARRGEATLIAVTINDPDDWRDHQALLHRGFSGVQPVDLAALVPETALPLAGGGTLTAGTVASHTVVLPADTTPTVSLRLPRFCYSTTSLLQPVGEAVVRLGDKELARLPLVCLKKDSREEKMSIFQLIRRAWCSIINWVVV